MSVLVWSLITSWHKAVNMHERKIFPKCFSSEKAKTGLFQLEKMQEMIESMSFGCLAEPFQVRVEAAVC